MLQMSDNYEGSVKNRKSPDLSCLNSGRDLGIASILDCIANIAHFDTDYVYVPGLLAMKR